MSETTHKIRTVLPQLMAAIGAIGKNNVNQHQRYNFRGIDQVLNHVGPACASFGVSVEVTIHDYQSNLREWDEGGKRKWSNHVTLRMRLAFTADDGSRHIAEAIGESVDTNGDKATNKAMSSAFKYACFMGLVIPVEGALDDSDYDPRHEERPTPRATQGPPQSQSIPCATPVAPEAIVFDEALYEQMMELVVESSLSAADQKIGAAHYSKRRTEELSELSPAEMRKMIAGVKAKIKAQEAAQAEATNPNS